MNGLFSGLEAFGLDDLDDEPLFDKKPDPAEQNIGAAGNPVVAEEDFLYNKHYDCPVCDNAFDCKTIKTGKTKLLGSDYDMRPRYEQVDLIKYDVIMCPVCGYTALTRYFKDITPTQINLIRAKIVKKFKPKPMDGSILSYEEALERYKLALANAIVKKGRDSEKAYICLKTAWLIRSMSERIEPDDPAFAARMADYKNAEDEFLKNALEGFENAQNSTEKYPMCGMDEITMEYLLAALNYHFKKYDRTAKILKSIMSRKGTNPRIQKRAQELWYDMVQEMRQQVQQKNQ